MINAATAVLYTSQTALHSGNGHRSLPSVPHLISTFRGESPELLPTTIGADDHSITNICL